MPLLTRAPTNAQGSSSDALQLTASRVQDAVGWGAPDPNLQYDGGIWGAVESGPSLFDWAAVRLSIANVQEEDAESNSRRIVVEIDVDESAVPNAKQGKGKGKGKAPADPADDVEAMVTCDWEDDRHYHLLSSEQVGVLLPEQLVPFERMNEGLSVGTSSSAL